MSSSYWTADLLGRKQDAEFLYNFLLGQVSKRRDQGRVASYVVNVDADWGGGKSFFLDGLAADIESRGHLVARINAWRDDHAEDPYVAIMAAIDKAFEPYIKKPGKIAKAWSAAKKSGGAIALKMGGAVLKGLLKKHGGVDLDGLSDYLNTDLIPGDIEEEALSKAATVGGEELEKLFDSSLEAMISAFKRTDEAMSDFRSKLEHAITAIEDKRRWPLFILVDELDRCRPTYAVQLLERVKHLFDVPGIVFVFATNSDQLQHSIAGAYGQNFNGYRYLKRFFDRTYVFDTPTTEKYIKTLCSTFPAGKLRAPADNNIALALTTGCAAFGFDLRAIAQVLEMVDAAATAWPHSLPADLVLLFPLCAHFYVSGKAEWPSAQLPQLTNWRFSRSRVDKLSEKIIDTSILYGKAYGTGVGTFQSLQQAMELGRGSDSSWIEYMRGTFNPEWNGVRINPHTPSIQADLLGLVANAGKMLTPSDTRQS